MRALQFVAVPLLATMAIAACEDGAPTSTARASTRASTAMDMGHFAAPVQFDPGGFTVEVLSRSSFPDKIDSRFRVKLDRERKQRHTETDIVEVTDPSDVVVAKVTLQPGGSLGWHTHPGPAIASVAAGELTIINATDCVTRRYAAGKAFIDLGQGHVHIGFNATAAQTVVYVTFLDVPAGQSPLIAANDPGC